MFSGYSVWQFTKNTEVNNIHNYTVLTNKTKILHFKTAISLNELGFWSILKNARRTKIHFNKMWHHNFSFLPVIQNSVYTTDIIPQWIHFRKIALQFGIKFKIVSALYAGHSGRAVWSVGLGWLVAGIVGSNPAQGMDVCPHLPVLCCLV
jgi:hypothetical protein